MAFTADQLIKATGANTVISVSAATATALLSAMVGDSGSGGTKGLAPAPAAGDAAAGKFLKADGTWAVPSTFAGITADAITGGDSSLGITGKAGVGSGTGGDVVIGGGQSAGALGSGGTVTIDAGASNGGGRGYVRIGASSAAGIEIGNGSGQVTLVGATTLTGASIDISTTAIGLYGTTPIAKQTGVAVTAEAIHAALVNLGAIGA